MFDSARQYRQDELPGEVFNAGNGDIKNYNGRAVKIGVNNNGTRNLSDMGDYGQYQSGLDVKNAAAANQAATDARFASNKNELTDFNSRFSSAVPNIVNATSQKYNLPGLLDEANGLNRRVSELQTNSNGAGAGGYASGTQVDKAVQTNYLPRAQMATQNLQTGTNLAQNEEQQLFQPYQTESTLLNERLAREATSYTAQQQQELDGLIAKMQSGVALTTAEIAKAQALAVAEKGYQGVLANANASQNVAKIGASNQIIPAGSTYYNPNTGSTYNPYI